LIKNISLNISMNTSWNMNKSLSMSKSWNTSMSTHMNTSLNTSMATSMNTRCNMNKSMNTSSLNMNTSWSMYTCLSIHASICDKKWMYKYMYIEIHVYPYMIKRTFEGCLAVRICTSAVHRRRCLFIHNAVYFRCHVPNIYRFR
jgi:hypothetical protein